MVQSTRQRLLQMCAVSPIHSLTGWCYAWVLLLVSLCCMLINPYAAVLWHVPAFLASLLQHLLAVVVVAASLFCARSSCNIWQTCLLDHARMPQLLLVRV
jgi:hypothetical protein